MADLRKITELDAIESLDNTEGLSIIANDNGQAKQIPASLLGGLSGGGSVCYYVSYGSTNIYADRERTTVVKADEFKEAMINSHVVFIEPDKWNGEDQITLPANYTPYNATTINVYSSNSQLYQLMK